MRRGSRVVGAGRYRVQVGEVGGEAAAELRGVAGVAVAGDDGGDAGDGGQRAQARAVAAEGIGVVQVGQRDLDVGAHVADDEHAGVREEDGAVAGGVGVVRVDDGARPGQPISPPGSASTWPNSARSWPGADS